MRYKRLLISFSIAVVMVLGLMAGLRGVPVEAQGGPPLQMDSCSYDGGNWDNANCTILDASTANFWAEWASEEWPLMQGSQVVISQTQVVEQFTICANGNAFSDWYEEDIAVPHAIIDCSHLYTESLSDDCRTYTYNGSQEGFGDGHCNIIGVETGDMRLLRGSCDSGCEMDVDWTITQPGGDYSCVPIASLVANGPITGSVGEGLAYTTTLVPEDATEPITWTWGANGDNFIDDLAGDSADITWWSSGTYTVSVTAENCGGGFGGDAMQVVITGVTYTPPFTIPTPVAPTFPPDCECPEPEFAVWEVGNWINWLWCNLLCWLQYFKDWLYYLWQLLYAVLLTIANTIIEWIWKPLQQIRMLLSKWFSQLIYTIRGSFGGVLAWLRTASDELVEWLNCTSTGLASFIQDFSDELESFLQGTSDNLAAWLQGFSDNLAAWLQDTSDEMASWLQGFSDNLASFIQGTSDNLSSWLQDTSDELTDFLNVSSVNIGGWFSSFSDELASWLQDTSDEMASWLQGTSDNLASFIQGTSNNLSSWLQDTSDYMSALLQYTADFLINVNDEIIDLLNHTSDEMASWLQGTSDNLEFWLQGTSDEMASWLQGTSDELTTWLNDSAGNITPWLNSILRSISYANLETGNWVQGTSDNLSSWLQDTSDEMASWLQGTSDNLELWLQGTSDNLASWIQDISDEMVELLNAAGESMVRLLRPIAMSVYGVLGEIVSILRAALFDVVMYLGQVFDVVEFVVDLIRQLITGLKDALNSDTEADLYETVPGLSAFWEGLAFFDETVGASPLAVLNVISLGIIAVNLLFWTAGQAMDMMEDIARW